MFTHVMISLIRKKVGIFIKDSLPYKIRRAHAFKDCIVVELVFRRKKTQLIILVQEFSSFFPSFEDPYVSENPHTVICW